MEQPLIIQLDTPCCTKEEYARRTGINVHTVDKMIQQGRIPILPKKGNEKVLVNLVLCTKMAASQSY